MSISKLKDIAKVISGYAFKSSDFISGDGIPAIKIKNIKNGDIDLSECDFVDRKFLSLNEKYHLKRNDILISLTGSHLTQPNSVVGRIALYRHSFTSLLNQRAGKVIPDIKLVDPLYLYAFLSQDSVKETIAKKARGAANQANISPGDVEDTEILLPPLPTQRRIASILSSYDDLIENNSRRIKILEETAQRTYEEWFVKFRVNGEQLIIDEKTGLPEGWEKKKITDFISFRQDKEKIKKFDNQLVYLATADVDGTQITGEGEPITWENKPSRAQKRLVKESVWFARMSNTYKVILANRNFKKDYVISSGFVGFRPKNNNCLPFLFCLINSDDFHSKKDLFATGATQVSLNDVSLSTIELLEPSITTIEMFGKQFNDTLELRQILIDQNQKLKESRDILLPKLMNGTINVQ